MTQNDFNASIERHGPKGKDGTIYTTRLFWDCNCMDHYIHIKHDNPMIDDCALCDSKESEQPDSRANEVVAAFPQLGLTFSPDEYDLPESEEIDDDDQLPASEKDSEEITIPPIVLHKKTITAYSRRFHFEHEGNKYGGTYHYDFGEKDSIVYFDEPNDLPEALRDSIEEYLIQQA